MQNWKKLFHKRQYFNTLLVGLMLLLTVQDIKAQTTYLFLRNHPQSSPSAPLVELKWFSEFFIYPEGVDVYRKTPDQAIWDKLNAEPVVPRQLADDDEDKFMIEAITAGESFNGELALLGLNILVRAFEENEFARKLGIYFVDSTAQWGVEYNYKVVSRDTKGLEFYMVDAHKVGSYKAQSPIEGVEYSLKDDQLLLNWRYEDRRYYAFEIAVSIADSVENYFLTERPVVPTRQKDSRGVLLMPDPLYRLTGLKDQTEYEFTVFGRDYFGERTAASRPIVVNTGDRTPPPPPENLQGKNDTLEVRLWWDYQESEDLAGFNIYYSAVYDSTYQRLNLLPVLSDEYSHTFDRPGPAYFYVAAVDSNGNESKSRTIFVEVPDLIPPPVPAGVAVKEDSLGVQLSWQHSDTKDLAGYRVYRTSRKDYSEPVLLNSDPVFSDEFLDTLPRLLQNRISYFVVAVDSNYNQSKPSEWVDFVFKDHLPPETPVMQSAINTPDGIEITWKPVFDEDLDYYLLERFDFQAISDYQAADTTFRTKEIRFRDLYVTSDSTYVYRVSAVDHAGNISYRSEKVSETAYLKSIEPSGSLRVKFRLRKKGERILLSWEAAESAHQFVVFGGNNENQLLPITGSLLQSSVEVENRYRFYQVRAFANGQKPLASGVVEVD
jgi:fibronectin type 3 domain-containing protein